MIDSHVHFWNYHPVKDSWITDDMKAIQRDFLPNELYDIYLEHHIQGCVAVQADQSEQETEYLLSLAEKHHFIKGIVGWVDLQSESLPEKLAKFSTHSKLKGWRHIVQAEPAGFMSSPSFLRGIAALKAYHQTYDILINKNQLAEAIALVDKFPEQRFVLDHIAKPNIKAKERDLEWRQNITKLAMHQNVYCKVSGMVTEADWQNWRPNDMKFYLDTVFESFAIDKLMFGSDWPVCTLAAHYKETKQIVADYTNQLTDTQRKAVFELNAITCYQL